MRQTTLALVFDNESNIILCMKKRGFGVGLYNGAGGKVEIGETIIAGAKRELFEETSIDVSENDLKYVGVLHFYFDTNTDWNQDVNLYVVKNYVGDFVESEEMKPEKFKISDIPFDKMWEDDIIWLPRVINNEEVEYDFIFDENGKIRDFKIIK
ncbi:MAG: 8-oxo-dGTP diphosphatase [Candidatus Gracilibacteria bacterium]|nr:8-oxo-dGTP diphosphatase [Candidatus Gracilibacteria bacterium]